MFVERLTEKDIENLAKVIIKTETYAKYVVQNQEDLTLAELGNATGIKGNESVFAYNRIVVKHNKVCKNITINGWFVYKLLFEEGFGKKHGERTYTISDFGLSATNEQLSAMIVSNSDIENVYRKFMFKKFGQEYVDVYVKHRKAEQRKNNQYFNNETKKNIDEMTK